MFLFPSSVGRRSTLVLYRLYTTQERVPLVRVRVVQWRYTGQCNAFLEHGFLGLKGVILVKNPLLARKRGRQHFKYGGNSVYRMIPTVKPREFWNDRAKIYCDPA